MILVSAVAIGEPAAENCRVLSSLDESVDAISAGAGDTLLVCSPEAAARPSLMAREVLARGDVALVTLAGSRTQQALLVRALSFLSPSSYGVAGPVVDTVRAQLKTRAAMSSVTRLSQARPSLMQHIRSFFPGASFDVDLVGGGVDSVKPIKWNVQGAGDICWAACSDLGDLAVFLVGGQPTMLLPPADDSPYGARKWAEVSTIDDLRLAVNRALTAVRTTSCRSCGRTIPTTGCPFCGTWIRPNTPASTPTAERRIP